MFKRRENPSQKQAQGAALIELVIERVQANPQAMAAFSGDSLLVEPQPLPADVLAGLTFPNGKPLPPSLKRWLAFDYTRLVVNSLPCGSYTILVKHGFIQERSFPF